MTAFILPQGKQQYEGFSGTPPVWGPLVGGKVYTFDSGTSNPRTTWQDSGQIATNANPIILDARGEAVIFWSGAYRVRLEDALGNTIWTVDGIADVLSSLGTSAGAGLVGFSPSTIYAAGTVGAYLNKLWGRTAAEIAAGITPTLYYYEPGNVKRYGAAGDGTTNDTVAVQAAHTQGAQVGGARPYLPSGSYLISTTITPCKLGMYGDGPAGSHLVCNGVDAFTITSSFGLNRQAAVFELFSINSNNGTSCDAKWAFNVPGVGIGAAVVYNSGLTIRDIEIGRTFRMGGGFYLKDIFEVKVTNVLMTDIQRAVQIVGSVAQSTFTDINALLGDAGAGNGLAGGYVGFSTESASYASGTLTPEAITTRSMALIVFDTGVQHSSGLDCNFYDTDVQAKVTGMAINAPCDAKGGIIIPNTAGVTAWTGVSFGVSPGPKDGRFVSNIEVSMGNMPGTPGSSYGFDMGDGASPVYGVVLKECSVKGLANSLQSLVRGRILKDLTMHDCRLEAAVALSTEISLSSVQRADIRCNHCPSGILAIGDGGDATANGVIEMNEITTLTLSPITTAKNWTIAQNDGLTPVRFAWEQGTATLTVTGCTTSPTGTCTWVKNGAEVMVYIPLINGTSNTTGCGLTGLPSDVWPSVQQEVIGRAVDNGNNGVCGYRIATNGVISMFFGAGLGVFTNVGTKGSNVCTLSYMIV